MWLGEFPDGPMIKILLTVKGPGSIPSKGMKIPWALNGESKTLFSTQVSYNELGKLGKLIVCTRAY